MKCTIVVHTMHMICQKHKRFHCLSLDRRLFRPIVFWHDMTIWYELCLCQGCVSWNDYSKQSQSGQKPIHPLDFFHLAFNLSSMPPSTCLGLGPGNPCKFNKPLYSWLLLPTTTKLIENKALQANTHLPASMITIRIQIGLWLIIILYVDWSDWSTQISTPDYDNLYTSLLNPCVTQTSKVVFSAQKRMDSCWSPLIGSQETWIPRSFWQDLEHRPPDTSTVKGKRGLETLNLWITIRPQTRPPIVYPRSLASSTCCRLNAKDCPKRST